MLYNRFFRLVLLRKKFILTVVFIIFVGFIGGYTIKNLIFTSSVLNLKQDEHKLINMTDFYFIHNPKEICSKRFQKYGKKNIISVVHSARSNFISREIIRRTHGSITTYAGWNIQVVFTLGINSSDDKKENIEIIDNSIKKEILHYGDIIIGNFEDTYHNLSYKHIMGYKWAIEYCSEANYYIKSDDDVIVNIFHVVEYLSNNNSSAKMDKDYYCIRFEGATPLRECNKCKWEITLDEYPNDTYPDYCGFGIYLTGMKTIKKIEQISTKSIFLWIDDVFVSGVLRTSINEKEFDPINKINLIQAIVYFNGYLIEKIEDAVRSKICLGVIEELKSPLISCSFWNLILEAHGVVDIYKSICNPFS